MTTELNLERLKRGVAPIQTMAEAKCLLRAQRDTFIIEEALSRLPKPPIRASSLVAALISIGCEVTRFDIRMDKISIKKPKAKKAKRFSILEILNTVADLIKNEYRPAMIRTGLGMDM